MNDDEAIRLFEADGGIAGEWARAQDPCTMNFYRKLAGGRMKPVTICKDGIVPNPYEGKPFAVDCDHCERGGVDLALFGDQDS